MNAARQKGTAWTTNIVRYLIERGRIHAELRALHGAQDRGDVAGIPGVVIEAKNEKAYHLAQWLAEATIEARNANAAIGVVWAHRQGVASAAGGYVIMSGATFVDLLDAGGY